MSVDPETVVFPQTFGFCGGVRSAVDLMTAVAEEAPEGVPVIGYHHIVHNASVTAGQEAAGVQFVDSVEEIPEGSAVVLSAHGVGPQVEVAIQQTGSETFDATCPLVTRTHHAAEKAREAGEKVLYICKGKPGNVEQLHDEVAGFVGWLDYRRAPDGTVEYDPIERSYLEIGDNVSDMPDILSAGGRYRIVTQTTLDASKLLPFREEVKAAIEAMQPAAEVVFSPTTEVCLAVKQRLEGVTALVARRPDRIVVVTDPHSKNGRSYVQRAEDLATPLGIPVYAVEDGAQAAELDDKGGITAVTASASSPDDKVSEVSRVYGGDTVTSGDRPFRLEDSDPAIRAVKYGRLIAGHGVEEGVA